MLDDMLEGASPGGLDFEDFTETFRRMREDD